MMKVTQSESQKVRQSLHLLFSTFIFLLLISCGNTNIKPIVKKADKLIDNGKIEDAIVHYQKAIQKHPHESVLYLNQAVLFRKEQKYYNAIRNYEVVKKLNPNSFWPYIGLGRVYLDQKKHDKARQVLKEGLKKLPKNGPILFHLGRVYYEIGDGNRAVEFLDKALDAKYKKMHKIYYYRALTYDHLLKNHGHAKMNYESYMLSSENGDHKAEVQKRLGELDLTRYDF